MPMSFQTAYYQQLYKLGDWTPDQGRIVAEIEHSPLGSTTPTMVVMEQHARVALGLDPCCEVDWSDCCATHSGGKKAIDWAAFLQTLEKILAIIGPFLQPA